MLETIERFKIDTNKNTCIQVPHDAVFLKAAFFHDGIYVWYKFGKNRTPDDLWITCIQDPPDTLPRHLHFLETIVHKDAFLVYHIFEVH